MPIRVKNITDGYYDPAIGKFRPIRWADDYDPTRTDDSGSRARARKKTKKAKAKKAKAKKAKAKKTSRKPASRRTPSKRSVKTTARSRKLVRGKPAKKVSRRKKAVRAMKNPIPSRFTTAKVRRLPGGDIQVLMMR